MGRIPRRIREAETDEVSVHGLWRTYATPLVRAGVPMPVVQELMGHYNWVSNTDKRKAVRKLQKDVK